MKSDPLDTDLFAGIPWHDRDVPGVPDPEVDCSVLPSPRPVGGHRTQPRRVPRPPLRGTRPPT